MTKNVVETNFCGWRNTPPRDVNEGIVYGKDKVQCTLLVFIDFCPVQSEFLTWSFVNKTVEILSEIIMEYQIQA